MSKPNASQNSRTLRLGLVLTFGLTLLIGLLLAMGAAHPPEVALAQGPTTRYVAPAPIGSDSSNDCITSSTPCATTQHAVDVAALGDEIRVATGTYTDVQARAGVTQVVYISKTLTIRGGYTTTDWATPYPVTQPTTLDAQEQGRVLYITGDISPTIEGLHITGGNAAGLGGSPWGDAGGGVYVITATVTMSNNQVFSNTASNGGGAFFYNSPEATLSDNIFSGNGLTTNAGGVHFYNSPTATLIANTISNNKAGPGPSMQFYGGVLFFQSDNATLIGNIISGNIASNVCGGVCFRGSDNATLIGNAIISNSAGTPGHLAAAGGGLHFVYSTGASLLSNTVTGNSSVTFGGGLYIGLNSTVALISNAISANEATKGGGLYLSSSDATLSGNTVTANTVHDYPTYNLDGHGGGVYITGTTSTVALTNTVIADNQAETAGSGVYIQNSSPHLLHTTIARNGGGDGSGVYITGTLNTVALTNTILVSHTVGITVTAGNTATLNGVLWYSNTVNYGGMGTITVMNEYTGTPAFAADGYHLTLSSEAIDKGVDAGVTKDIDGYNRPCGLAPDLGGDEINCLYIPVILKNSG